MSFVQEFGQYNTLKDREIVSFLLLLLFDMDLCIEPDIPIVALMVTDNIDNLECMISGAGTSHRVNSILTIKRKSSEDLDVDS